MIRRFRDWLLWRRAYRSIPGKTVEERSAAVHELIDRIERQAGPEV